MVSVNMPERAPYVSTCPNRGSVNHMVCARRAFRNTDLFDGKIVVDLPTVAKRDPETFVRLFDGAYSVLDSRFDPSEHKDAKTILEQYLNPQTDRLDGCMFVDSSHQNRLFAFAGLSHDGVDAEVLGFSMLNLFKTSSGIGFSFWYYIATLEGFNGTGKMLTQAGYDACHLQARQFGVPYKYHFLEVDPINTSIDDTMRNETRPGFHTRVTKSGTLAIVDVETGQVRLPDYYLPGRVRTNDEGKVTEIAEPIRILPCLAPITDGNAVGIGVEPGIVSNGKISFDAIQRLHEVSSELLTEIYGLVYADYGSCRDYDKAQVQQVFDRAVSGISSLGSSDRLVLIPIADTTGLV